MIDIHSHLLYNVDDGSKNIDESVKIIKNLISQGITDIILTPHYINYSEYTSTKKENQEKLKELQKQIKDVNLYLGNEIYIDEEISNLIKNNEISPLNDTKYLLIELPMSGENDKYRDIFLDLMNEGYKVILAHPERYITFQKDFSKVEEMINIGVLLQCNIGSILKQYGRKAKKTFIKILKSGYVSYIGTDIHHEIDYNIIKKAQAKMQKYVDEKTIEDIFINNAKKMLR